MLNDTAYQMHRCFAASSLCSPGEDVHQDASVRMPETADPNGGGLTSCGEDERTRVVCAMWLCSVSALVSHGDVAR